MRIAANHAVRDGGEAILTRISAEGNARDKLPDKRRHAPKVRGKDPSEPFFCAKAEGGCAASHQLGHITHALMSLSAYELGQMPAVACA